MSTGLVGYWKLDETSGTSAIDSTGYGHPGTYVNSPTLNVAPPSALTFPSTAVTLNGTTQVVTIPMTGNSSLFEETYSLWVKPTNNTGQQRYLSVGPSNSAGGNWVGIEQNGPDIRAYNYDGTGPHYVTAANAVTVGSWMHIVYVRSSINSIQKLYVNNVPTSNGTIYVDSAGTHTFISIGSNNGQTLTFFNGSIDDVRYYNYPLSTGEISGLYAGSIQPLAGAWSVMRGNPSAVAIDSSASGSNGTLSGISATDNQPPAITYMKNQASTFFYNYNNTQVTISNPVTVTAATGFSIAAWVKWDGVIGNSGYNVIFGGSNANLLTLVSGAVSYYDSGNKATSAITLTAGTWYHLVATVNTTNTKIFINGTQSGATGSAGSSSMTPQYIAKYNYTQSFGGSLSDVRYYGKVLSGAEITDLAAGNIGLTDSTLKGWWKLNTPLKSMIKGNPSAVAVDSSGNGNNGTFVGGVSPSAPAPLVSAGFDPNSAGISLNGSSQYVDAGTGVGNFAAGTPFSVAYWFNATKINSTNQGLVMRENPIGTINNGWICLLRNTNKMGLAIIDSTGVNYRSSDTSVITSGWHHFVGVYDGTNVDTYLDGVANGTRSNTGTLGTTTGAFNLNIGRHFQASQFNYFTGAIDDVRVYSAALSSGEVSTLYTGALGRMTNLVGWWKLDSAPQSLIT